MGYVRLAPSVMVLLRPFGLLRGTGCRWSAGTEIPERGVWELSKDGNFLLLHACARNQPNVCESTTVYQMVYCDDHSLQLKPVTQRVPTKEMALKPQPDGLLSFIK